jgi:uncharacterized Zn finger protein (UPF0148 family)
MDDPTVLLRLMCPECFIKLWFDEDHGEFFCPGCSYTVEDVTTNADLL